MRLRVLESDWVPFAEALAMTRDGRITDVKSIIGLTWASYVCAGGAK